MKILTLRVKKKYFDQIKSGEKTEEYRLSNSYWYARLHGKSFDGVVIIHGWVANSKLCEDNCISFPFNGITMKTIQHDEFSEYPVTVYAIKLQEKQCQNQSS
jgi:hypothetical protein